MPTFDELKQFIRARPEATICEIRDKFGQKGDSIISTKQYVLAYSIKSEFWRHLQEFMKQPYVTVDLNMLACRISDSTRYVGPGQFLPIVLSIKN